MDDLRPRTLFVVGDGYSGSTLLDLILGAHSRMIGVGEVQGFDRFLATPELCSCGAVAPDCPFWRAVLERMHSPPELGELRLQPPEARRSEVIERTARLFAAVLEVAGVDVVVDSSKRYRRARPLVESGRFGATVVHLLRDPRGVAYSHLRRDESFESALEYWCKTNREIAEWLEASDAPPHRTIHYEELCRDPASVGRRICELAGLEWEPAMLASWDRTYHNVGGNLMRFERGPRAIRLDERWREALDDGHAAAFEAIAGETARRLGYRDR